MKSTKLTSTQAEVLDNLCAYKRIESNDYGTGYSYLRPGSGKAINITGTLKALAKLGLARGGTGTYFPTDEGKRVAEENRKAEQGR